MAVLTPEEVERRWGVRNTTTTLSQIKATKTPIFDKYFKDTGVGVTGGTVSVKIEKGSGLILQSVSPEAEHLLHERPTLYEIEVKFPRFPLENTIGAAALNNIAGMDAQNQPIQLAYEIGKIQKEHRLSFDTTLEYMCTGALFGKVMDGKGKTLFEFASSRTPVEFKSGKLLIDSINEIDDAMTEELGENPGWVAKCGRTFMNDLSALAKAQNLFVEKNAEWINDGELRVLMIHGARFEPYVKKYKNTAGQVLNFVADNEMAAIPESAGFTKLYYGRADHTEAVKSVPTLFFGSVEALEKGRGVAVLSEMKPLPTCLNPNAVIRGKKA